MKFIKSKKGISLLAAVAVIAISAVGAYAYFKSPGQGAGTANVGTVGVADISIISSTSGNLFPLAAAPAANTDITVTNNGAGNEFVNQVTETGIAVDSSHSSAGCLSSWFKFNGSPITVGQNLAPNASATILAATSHATVWLQNDPAVDQSSCEGATLTVSYTSN